MENETKNTSHVLISRRDLEEIRRVIRHVATADRAVQELALRADAFLQQLIEK